MGWDEANNVLVLCVLVWICTLAYVPCYGNRKYVSVLAHALDATVADDPCFGNRKKVATLAHP